MCAITTLNGMTWLKFLPSTGGITKGFARNLVVLAAPFFNAGILDVRKSATNNEGSADIII
jgi:hypothetical protein